jgi:hypothetical protein
MPEFSSSTYSETDASNNSAAPNGMPEGMAPGGVNNAWRAAIGATKRFWGRINPVYASTGTAGGYLLAHSVALSTYSGNELIAFRAHTTGAATPTVNVDSLGAILMKKYTSSGKSDLDAGDIQGGQMVMGYHDGSHFVVVSPMAPAGAATANDPTFVTVTTSSTLQNERQFNTAFPATFSDGGAGGALLVSVNTASQALMEAGTTNAAVVTPGALHHHPGVAKAWALITLSGGTPSVTTGHNVTGVVDQTTGDTTVQFGVTFSSTNYCVVVTPFDTTVFTSARVFSRATTECRVNTVNAANTLTDVSFHIAVFGDLA